MAHHQVLATRAGLSTRSNRWLGMRDIVVLDYLRSNRLLLKVV